MASFAKRVVSLLPHEATSYFSYRYKRLQYAWANDPKTGMIAKSLTGLKDDIVYKDWLRETHNAKHDITQIWLSVAGAVIGGSILIHWESKDRHSSVGTCTALGTLGAILGGLAGGLAHMTLPVIGAGIVMVGISNVAIKHQSKKRDAENQVREAAEKVRRHNQNLERYTEYVVRSKDKEETIMTFDQWKQFHHCF